MKRSKFDRKLDGFFRGLFFEENGKPKSASLLYSFLMAILFILVYGACYLLLLGPLEKAFSGASVSRGRRGAWRRERICGWPPCS